MQPENALITKVLRAHSMTTIVDHKMAIQFAEPHTIRPVGRDMWSQHLTSLFDEYGNQHLNHPLSMSVGSHHSPLALPYFLPRRRSDSSAPHKKPKNLFCPILDFYWLRVLPPHLRLVDRNRPRIHALRIEKPPEMHFSECSIFIG